MITVYGSVKDYVLDRNPIINPERVYTGQVVSSEEGAYLLATTRYLSDPVLGNAKLGGQLISLTDGNRWSEECLELMTDDSVKFKSIFSVSYSKIEESLHDEFS